MKPARRASALLPLVLALGSSACTDMGLEFPDLKGESADTKGVYQRPSAAGRTSRGPKGGSARKPADPRPVPGTSSAGDSGVGGSGAGDTDWTDGPDAPPPVFAGDPRDGHGPTPSPDVPPPPPPPDPLTPPAPPRITSPGQLTPAAGTSDADPLYFSFLGKALPDFVGEGTWLTPASGPNVSALRGQVLFVVFSFQGCEGCKVLMPTLRQWSELYGPRGVTVIYVDNGVIDPVDYARRAIREQGVRYAYFHDAKAETIKAYGVRAFPTAYIVGKDGNVVWEGTPTAQEAILTPILERELAK